MKDHPDTPPILQQAIAGARAQAPTRAQLERLAARLPLGGGGPGGGKPPGGGTGGSLRPPVVAAPAISSSVIAVAVGAVVAGASLLWQVRGSGPSSRPPPAESAALVTSAAPPPTTEAPPTFEGPAAAPLATAAAPRIAPAPATPTPSNALAAPAATAEVGGASGPVVGPAETEGEAHLLERARNALGGSPAGALALTEEHAHRFPSGALAQEREVVAIQALVQLGRRDEARARAARFLSVFPASAHRRRIEALVGSSP